MRVNKEIIQKNLKEDIFVKISEASDDLGVDSYVVGGYVRDLCLRRPVKKDIDVMCVGSGIELAQNFYKRIRPNITPAKINIFKRFGTAMIKFNNYNIEFVGARKESYSNDSRKPSIEEGTFLDDMLRRDFTINTLAIRLNKNYFGELIDTFGGIDDIEKGIIKTPTDPDKTFSDDPLRMLRAIRFSCELNFDIDMNTQNSIKKNSNRLEILSSERISDCLLYTSPSPRD